jgi:hypothetical protein
MRRIASGIALLFLAACSEGTPPAPPKPMAGPESKSPAMDAKPPMMDAKPSPPPKPVEEEKPKTEKKPEGEKKSEHADKKGRAKSPELFKKFMAIMDDNGDLMDAIKEDLENKKYESAVKPRVVKIRKNAEAARALHYRKDPDEDAALTNDFDLFLLKMKKIEESLWDEGTSHDLFENLSGRCLTCHDTYQ